MSEATQQQWVVTSGEDLRGRIRAGQHLEHDVKGYFLAPSLERVSPIAVAQERMRIDRMRTELGVANSTRAHKEPATAMNIEQLRKKERELALQQWRIRTAQGAAMRAAKAEEKGVEAGKDKKEEGKERGGREL